MACPYDAVTKETVDEYVRGLTAPLAPKGSVEDCASVRTTRWIDIAHIVLLAASLPVTALLFWQNSSTGWAALEWLSLGGTALALLRFRHAFVVVGRLAWHALGSAKFALLMALVGAATTRLLDSYRASPSLPLPVFRALLGVTAALTLARLALLVRTVSRPGGPTGRLLALAASLNGVLDGGHISSIVGRLS